jgi:predicted amidohydrolase YtcJ
VDSHTHIHEFGQQKRKAYIEGLLSVEEMVTELKRFFPNPTPGQWLIGQGWDEGVWASMGYPDRQLLDEAFPVNPVRLQSLHGFGGFYNGKALEIAGIDANTPDPEVGRIMRRTDGTPTGVMETLAQQLVNQHIPAETVAEAKEAILLGAETLLQAGVTTVHEAGVSPTVLQAYMELAKAEKLPIRVYAMLNGNDDKLMEEWFERGPYVDPNGYLFVRSIKVFYDGSLGSRTALMAAAYSDNPKAAQMTERIRPDKVRELGKKAAAKGFQMAVHSIGDEANRRVLDLYDEALVGYENIDHRWRMEHAQVVLPSFFERAAEAKYISSVQSSHAVGDSKWAEDRVGNERIKLAYAWRSIMDAGAPIILNSDLPGEPWTPIETLYFAVTRKNLNGEPAGGWYPEQAFTVMEALQAMTITGAYAAFMDNETGSIAKGKKADFVVLNQNPLNTPADSLKELKVESVWVNGDLVPVIKEKLMED